MAALVAAAVAPPAGCGSDEDGAPTGAGAASASAGPLTPDERRRAQRAERRVIAYCARAVRALARGEEPVSPRARAEALGEVERLLALAARKPSAQVETGIDMRLFVGDLAEDLEGSNCDPSLVEAIDAGLARIPSG